MEKSFLSYLVILLLVTPIARGQDGIQLNGTISVHPTKTPVEGATIALKRLDDSVFHRITKTTNSGAFRFSGLAEGRYYLIISHLGFKKVRTAPISLNAVYREVTFPDIELEEDDSNMLKEVVVVSEKQFVEQRLDRIVLNVNSLISNAGVNAADVLNNAPGVLVDDNGSISLRGIGGVMILVDDKPTHLSGSDLVNYLRSLPSRTLDKIEIMSNPPAKYQSSGSGGIINVKTKKNRNQGFHGNVSLNYGRGGYSKSNNSMSFSYKTNRVNYFLNASYSLNDNFYDVSRIRRYLNDSVAVGYTLIQDNHETNRKESMNYRLGVDYDINSRTSLGVLVNGFNSPYSEDGSYQNQFTGVRGKVDSMVYVVSDLRNYSRNNAVSAVLTKKFSAPGNELNLDLDYLSYHVESRQVSQSDSYLPDGSFMERYILLSSNDYSAEIFSSKLDYSKKIFGDGVFETGLQAIFSFRNSIGDYYNRDGNLTTSNALLNNLFEFQENINSGYISARKSFNRLSIQTGLRVENTTGDVKSVGATSVPSAPSLTYANLFPTIHLSYRLGKNSSNRLNFSAGRRISRPDYQDLNPSMFFFDRNTSNRGNPLLTPDFSSNFDLSYDYQGKLSAGLMHHLSRDRIVSVYNQVGEAFVLTMANIDRVVISGLHARGTFGIGQWFTSNLYGELINASYKGIIFGDEELDNSFTSFNFSGQNKIKLNESWIAAVGGQFRGHRITAQGSFKPIGQLNMNVQKKILKGNGTIVIGARDIFHSWVVRREMSIKNADVVSSNTNDTRQVSISFSYRFGKALKSRIRRSGIQTEAGRAGL